MVRTRVMSDDWDEVIYVGWGEPGGEWTQWGWRNEEGSWVTYQTYCQPSV